MKSDLWKCTIFTFVFIASLFLTSSARAQEKSQNDGTQTSEAWVSAGAGGSHFGPCFYGSISYRSNNNLFTVRYFKSDEFVFNVDGVYDKPFLTCKEFGILYGISYIKPNGVVSVSAGVGYVSGTDRGKKIADHQFDPIDIATLGLPFEAKLQINIFGPIGLGAAWFGNINSTKSYTGGILELVVRVF